MHVRLLTQEYQPAWDQAVSRHSADGGLLQSWAWGEFQRAYGRTVVRLGAVDTQGQATIAWQLVRHALPLRQHYLYGPRVALPSESADRADLLQAVVAAARTHGCVFARVDALLPEDFSTVGWHARRSMQPAQELLVDLQPTPDELLAAMKPKTRYNIGLAQRHDVTVEHHGGRSALGHIWQDCYRLMSLTAQRQGIRLHPKRYYHQMVSVLGDAGMLEVALARRQGEVLAAAIVVTFGGVATYLHGGSGDAGAEWMAPHLLHWQAMLRARECGCSAYNLGGVSLTRPAWAGITRFKQGFSPQRSFLTYGSGWELPIRRVEYALYQTLQRLRGANKQ